MSRILLGYQTTQIVLLPLFILLFCIAPGRCGVRFAWRLHRVVFLLGLALPALLLAWPFPSFSRSLSLPPVVVSAVLSFPTAARETSAALSNATAPVSARGSLSPGTVATLAAIAPSVVGLLVFAARLARQKRREARLARCGSVRRFGRVRVVMSREIAIPFSAGIVRPTLFMPQRMAENRRDRGMVIVHEREHLRGVHYIWTVSEALLAGLFWFNPFAHLLARDGVRIRELICDLAALRRYPAAEYGSFLVSTAARKIVRRRAPLLADGWNVRRQFMERISFILGGVRERRAIVRMAAGLAGLLTTAFLLLAAPFLTPLAAEVAAGVPTGFPVDARVDSVRIVSSAALTTVTVTGQVTGSSEKQEMTIVNAAITGDEASGAITLYGRLVTSMVTSSLGAGRSGPSPSDGLYFLMVGERPVQVLATASSTVAQADRAADGICHVTLRTDSGYQLSYSYLGSAGVSPGDRVGAGKPIGVLSTEQSQVLLFYQVSIDGKTVNPFPK